LPTKGVTEFFPASQPLPDGFGGAITFKADLIGVPIYFVPWEPLSLVSLVIPDTGGAFYSPDDSDYPGLFFTAAIISCQ